MLVCRRTLGSPIMLRALGSNFNRVKPDRINLRSSAATLQRLAYLHSQPLTRFAESKEQAEHDPYAAQRRTFSEALTQFRETMSSPAGIAVMGGAVALYVAYEITKFLSHVTFTNIGEYAFIFGMVAAAGAGAAAWSGSRLLLLRPEAFYRQTLKRVSKDSRAANILGASSLKPGAFRAYSLVPPSSVQAPVEASNGLKGLARLTAVNKLLRPKVLRLMFTVKGEGGPAGVVSAQIYKQGNNVTYQSLYVTNLRNGERVLLEGEQLPIYEKTMQLLDPQ